MKLSAKELAAILAAAEGEKERPAPAPELATRKPDEIAYCKHGIFVFRMGRGWA